MAKLAGEGEHLPLTRAQMQEQGDAARPRAGTGRASRLQEDGSKDISPPRAAAQHAGKRSGPQLILHLTRGNLQQFLLL